jgi:hypothetical protein
MRPLLLGASLASVVLSSVVALAADRDDCFNAAEATQKLKGEKKLSAAREQVLVCSRDVCPGVVRADCAKWLTEIDAAMPTVVIRARDESGHDLIEVRVLVDGVEVKPKLDGIAIPLDPGQHKLRYEPAGKPAVEDTILAVENEKGRVLRVDLRGGGQPATPPPIATPPRPTTRAGASPAPWIIGGAGVASLVVFGVLEIVAQGEYSDLKNGCGATRSCTDSQVSGTQTKFVAAGITMGLGIAALAVAIPWLIVGATKKSEAKVAAAYWMTGRF